MRAGEGDVIRRGAATVLTIVPPAVQRVRLWCVLLVVAGLLTGGACGACGPQHWRAQAQVMIVLPDAGSTSTAERVATAHAAMNAGASTARTLVALLNASSSVDGVTGLARASAGEGSVFRVRATATDGLMTLTVDASTRTLAQAGADDLLDQVSKLAAQMAPADVRVLTVRGVTVTELSGPTTGLCAGALVGAGLALAVVVRSLWRRLPVTTLRRRAATVRHRPSPGHEDVGRGTHLAGLGRAWRRLLRSAGRLRPGETCVLLGAFLKQFYLGASGTLQAGDLFLAIGMLLVLTDRRRPAAMDRRDLLIASFVCVVLVVDGVWLLAWPDLSFAVKAAMQVFSLLMIIGGRALFEREHVLRLFRAVLCLDILTQAVVWLAGAGRRYGADRYTGTFNDPNQFAFFLFMCLLLLLVLTVRLEDGHGVLALAYVAVLPLVIASGSTGMTLGYVLALVPLVWVGAHGLMTRDRRRARVVVASLVVVLIGGGVYGFLALPDDGAAGAGEEAPASVTFLAQRLTEKVDKLEDGSADAGTGSVLDNPIVKDRQLGQVLLHPELLVLGAGEGAYTRWQTLASTGEVHSTWIGLWYYYGLLGIIAMGAWVWANVHRSSVPELLAVVAVLAESMTLANQRQPFLWLLFTLIGTAMVRIEQRRPQPAFRRRVAPTAREGDAPLWLGSAR